MTQSSLRLAEKQPLVTNPRVTRNQPYPQGLTSALSPEEGSAAQREISTWPGYAKTPLCELPDLAEELGIATVHYKDEGGRFGLGSFKALGGAYAVMRFLARQIAEASAGRTATAAQLLAGAHRDLTQGLTVCCATDGNHGRSVAWGASIFGCRCVIYVHETVSQGRIAAIEKYGAEVVRHHGNYDETIRLAADDAARNGWTVVSDTSYEGYTEIPKDVMHGYALMAFEAFDQWPDETPPTHVVVPGGVGGVAAAVCASSWWRHGAARPVFIVVEPTRAACLLESAAKGERVLLEGDIETVMAGLSCGEPSLLAWQVLDRGIDHFVAVTDAQAVSSMRRLAAGTEQDAPIVSGESAASVVAALEVLCANPDYRAATGLNGDARVMVFGTEADTDQDVYVELVGRTGDQVRAEIARHKNGRA